MKFLIQAIVASAKILQFLMKLKTVLVSILFNLVSIAVRQLIFLKILQILDNNYESLRYGISVDIDNWSSTGFGSAALSYKNNKLINIY